LELVSMAKIFILRGYPLLLDTGIEKGIEKGGFWMKMLPTVNPFTKAKEERRF
jgi:hypothetical protein